jgi:uncharacterized membrane protein
VLQFWLFLHVLGAIVALGFSLSYALWITRGDASGPTERAFALRTISWIDRRATTPAYILQFVTGAIMVGLIDWDLLREPWLEASIGIYVVLTALAITKFAPAHRRHLALAERAAEGETVDEEIQVAARTSRMWGIAVTILTLVILLLMVVKPDLW